MTRPQGFVTRGVRDVGGVVGLPYDDSKAYDTAVVYSGAYDFVSNHPTGVVQLDKPRGSINQYG